jgi:hypothetical protein
VFLEEVEMALMVVAPLPAVVSAAEVEPVPQAFPVLPAVLDNLLTAPAEVVLEEFIAVLAGLGAFLVAVQVVMVLDQVATGMPVLRMLVVAEAVVMQERTRIVHRQSNAVVAQVLIEPIVLLDQVPRLPELLIPEVAAVAERLLLQQL